VRLGIDPNDVRRRNAISKDEMPYYRPLEALGEEIEHDSGDYVGLLEKLLVMLEWDKLKVELARRRASGEAVGAGMATRGSASARAPRPASWLDRATKKMTTAITPAIATPGMAIASAATAIRAPRSLCWIVVRLCGAAAGAAAASAVPAIRKSKNPTSRRIAEVYARAS